MRLHWLITAFITLFSYGIVTPCLVGQYQTTVNGTCLTCQAGNYCNGTDMQPCSQGTFQPNVGMGVCFPCSPGFHQPEPGATYCRPCPPGLFCNNTVFAYMCPKGFSQPAMNQVSCIPCLPGTYQTTDGSPTCVICPPGSYCPEQSISPIPCPPGTYSATAGTAMCTECPFMTFQVHNGSTSCDQCPQGYQCSSSYGVQQCPAGSYQNQWGYCDNCPVNYYQPHAGQTSCIICPAGSTCNDATQPPVPCPPGAIAALQGQSRCTQCPQGTYSNGNGSSSCFPCPTGYQCSSWGTSQPLPCSPGTFQARRGQWACDPCPPGMHQSMPGSTSCNTCPAGYQCPYQSISPIPCMAGSYQPNTGQAYCTPCSPGYYCPQTNGVPIACDSGFYQSLTGMSSCMLCPAGTYTLTNGSSSCQQCPAGFYCVNPNQPPAACPIGSYQSLPGQVNCTTCSGGYYQQNPGQESCNECPVNYMCPDPAQAPQACPTGMIQPLPGQSACISQVNVTGSTIGPLQNCSVGYFKLIIDHLQECVACPIGNSCPTMATQPIPCMSGQYQNNPGQGTCKQCPVGTYQPNVGASSCISCSQGYGCDTPAKQSYPLLCPPGTYFNAYYWACSPCSSGTFTNNAGMSSCIACPAGYYCPYTNQLPIACPAGQYMPYIQSNYCYQCRNGDYTNQPASQQCLSCPSGYTCLNNIQPIPCAAGTYSSGGRCYSCSSGYYQPSTGKSICYSCPPQYYCPAGSVNAIPCPPGTYAADSVGSCTTCEGGNICSGSGNPVPCPPGTFTTDGISCQTCPPGHYSGTGSSSCSSCPAGNMCPTGSTNPQPCPPGKYQSNSGQSVCVPCSTGYYQLNTGSTFCTQVPPGTYWNGVTQLPIDCPLGSYQSSYGQSTCTLADPGTFAGTSGQSSPSACGEGVICPGIGNTQPMPCPASTCRSCGREVDCQTCSPNPNCPTRTGQVSSNQACPTSYPGWGCLKSQGDCILSNILPDIVSCAYEAANVIWDASKPLLDQVQLKLNNARTQLNTNLTSVEMEKTKYIQRKNANIDWSVAIEEKNKSIPMRGHQYGESPYACSIMNCFETAESIGDVVKAIWNKDWAEVAHGSLSALQSGFECLRKEIPGGKLVSIPVCMATEALSSDCISTVQQATDAAAQAIANAYYNNVPPNPPYPPFPVAHFNDEPRIMSDATALATAIDSLLQNMVAYSAALIQFSQQEPAIADLLATINGTCFNTLLNSTSLAWGDDQRTISVAEMQSVDAACTGQYPIDNLNSVVMHINDSISKLNNNVQLAGTFVDSAMRATIPVSGLRDPSFSLTPQLATAYRIGAQSATSIHQPVWTQVQPSGAELSASNILFYAVMPKVSLSFRGYSLTNLTAVQYGVGIDACPEIISVYVAPDSSPLTNATITKNAEYLLAGSTMFTSIRPMYLIACGVPPPPATSTAAVVSTIGTPPSATSTAPVVSTIGTPAVGSSLPPLATSLPSSSVSPSFTSSIGISSMATKSTVSPIEYGSSALPSVPVPESGLSPTISGVIGAVCGIIAGATVALLGYHCLCKGSNKNAVRSDQEMQHRRWM